ncbi:IS66 family transposase [Variovorax sp. LT1R16]|uniref:IS66 family transposase n=1 Tax=Variovorax sp. LT1R16 TaxID=3443728 RepID=UPI003F47DD7D
MAAKPVRIAAGCLAHARRKFDELLRDNGKSAVATEALQRIARNYRIERELVTLTSQERLASRNIVTQSPWEELHTWPQLERARVHDAVPRLAAYCAFEDEFARLLSTSPD